MVIRGLANREEDSTLLTTFCIFVTIGHIFAIIVPKDNEDETYYYLCHCVQAKQKLDH